MTITHHSTETAVLKVLIDILLAVAADNGDLSVLALLDLSTAFDTVDREIVVFDISPASSTANYRRQGRCRLRHPVVCCSRPGHHD